MPVGQASFPLLSKIVPQRGWLLLSALLCRMLSTAAGPSCSHKAVIPKCLRTPAADKIREDDEDDTPTEEKAHDKVAGFLDRVANEAGPKADQAIDNAKGQARGLTGQSGLRDMWVGDVCSASGPLYKLF